MVAHDLKSPLASIRFSVDMLAEEPRLRDERVQDLLASLTESANRTLAFIDEFLNLNAAANTVALDSFRPFRVDDVVRMVIGGHAPGASEKCIRIDVDCAEVVEVFGDPLAAEHVIENLLSNALKFAPFESSVRVAIENGQPGIVRVRVLDRGPGVAPGDRHRLFQRYVRLSARPTSGESSTGLGLSIAKQLAEAMHGSLLHEDREGGGSVFTFELPTRPVS
jgi:two-component system sensor histidine kinase/response regulator